MASIFTKIIKGDIPGHVIAEDDNNIAILDINPLVKGHCLVIPKNEVDYIFDLTSEEYQSLMSFSKKVAEKIKNSISCLRVGVAVIGLEVPHAHVHLVPLNIMDDINFSRPKLSPSHEELNETAELIRNSI